MFIFTTPFLVESFLSNKAEQNIQLELYLFGYRKYLSRIIRTKCYCEIENDGHKVPKSEGPVLPHVAKYQDAHDLSRQTEAHLQQGIPQPFSPEDARLLLAVGPEDALPELQADDEVLELRVGQPADAGLLLVERHHDLAADLDTGAGLDVVCSERREIVELQYGWLCVT